MKRGEIPVVYVAGPFRGPTAWEVECNVRRAEEVALEVARLGAMPMCPHTNTRFFDGQCTDTFWLEGTRELMRRCDALVTVDGWSMSEGASEEVAVARGLQIPVFHTTTELRKWLQHMKG